LAHAECKIYRASGYSGSRIGVAPQSSALGKMDSEQACCDACSREPGCGKFTFNSDAFTCVFYPAYAERYITADNIVAGIVGGGVQLTATQFVSEATYISAPSPGFPAFRSAIASPPPPLHPPKRTAIIGERIVTGLSLAVGGTLLLIILGCLVCCFISSRRTTPTGAQAGGGKKSRRNRRPPGARRLPDAEEPVLEEASPWHMEQSDAEEVSDEDAASGPDKLPSTPPKRGQRRAQNGSGGGGAMWEDAEQVAMRLVEERIDRLASGKR